LTEILFYHLEQRPLEQVLPLLLEKSLARGWNALVQVGKNNSGGKVDAEEGPVSAKKGQQALLGSLGKALWTFRDDSFLPHCIFDPEQSKNEEYDQIDYENQPVLLCSGDQNPNIAQIRFYVAGAVPADKEMLEAGEYQRLVFMFDGHDPDAVIEARQVWKNFSKTHQATYWQQDESGNWAKKA